LAFSEATQLAKAILRQINNERLAQWPDVRLSASFGLAWTEDPAHSPDDLSRNADELMYRAKKASKDTSTSRLALQGAEEIEVIGQDI
jgi:GGDEF domain-containing protein